MAIVEKPVAADGVRVGGREGGRDGETASVAGEPGESMCIEGRREGRREGGRGRRQKG